MKYLVVSDNHGDRDILLNLVNTYRGKVDKMFHCGDSELEPTDELWKEMVVVTGNCDYDSRFKKSQTITVGDDVVYMTHGHLSNVRQNINKLFYEAKEVGATIALFGHTHQLGVERIEDMLLLNPGSIRLPRGKYMIKTYAIIDSLEDSYQVQYYNERHEAIPELAFDFRK